ncbi:MAG: MlaE family ABC transporter permease [Campylobacterales bacterium]
MFKILENFFAFLGRPVINLSSILDKIGVFTLFHIKLVPLYFTKPFRLKETFKQMENIGVNSSGVIILTAIFTGMVLAIQFYQGFHKFGADAFMGYTIFIAITRELGPVFAALMVTSRAISAMSAELGTMRVTEQIDAIDTLSVDSRRYLVVPRIIATTASLPLLVILFDFVGNVSAYLVSVHILDVNSVSYIENINQYLTLTDITNSLIKALVFGYLIALIGTFTGYFTKGGARGVGIATTTAVVVSSVAIFATNYLLSALFLTLDW